MLEKINCNRYGDLTVSCVINLYILFEYINFCISVTAGLYFSYTLPDLSLSAVVGNGYFPISSIYFFMVSSQIYFIALVNMSWIKVIAYKI